MNVLAVFTPQIGRVSETFIRKHVEDLRPGQTVAVVRYCAISFGGQWRAGCPLFFIDRWRKSLRTRLTLRLGSDETQLRARAIAGFLRRHKVGAVLGEYLDQFADFVPLLNSMGIPYVVQGHGIDLSASLRRSGMAHTYRRYTSAKAILTRCEFHRQRLVSIGLPAEKIHVNPGGVTIPATAPVRGPQSARRFLAIGRMVPKKAPLLLLEAFALALESNPAISLDYVGDGALFGTAQDFVRTRELSDKLRLHGMAPEAVKTRLLGECATFVQHSITDPQTGDEEGLPASIQEAMANGMAVISTRHAGIPEAVDDGQSGLLVDEGDVAAMAAAILRIAASPGLAAQLGAVGRAKAASDYSWEAERNRLLSYLPVM